MCQDHWLFMLRNCRAHPSKASSAHKGRSREGAEGEEQREKGLAVCQGVPDGRQAGWGTGKPGCLTPTGAGQAAAACARRAQSTSDSSCVCWPSVRQILGSPSELGWKQGGPCGAPLSQNSSSLLSCVGNGSAPLYSRLPVLKGFFQGQHGHEDVARSCGRTWMVNCAQKTRLS